MGSSLGVFTGEAYSVPAVAPPVKFSSSWTITSLSCGSSLLWLLYSLLVLDAVMSVSSKPFSMASISAASQVSRRVSFLPPLSNTMSPNTSELFCSSSLVLLRILSSSSEPPTNVSRLVFFDALFLALFDALLDTFFDALFVTLFDALFVALFFLPLPSGRPLRRGAGEESAQGTLISVVFVSSSSLSMESNMACISARSQVWRRELAASSLVLITEGALKLAAVLFVVLASAEVSLLSKFLSISATSVESAVSRRESLFLPLSKIISLRTLLSS